jgi:anti-sigma B factor antagonist
MLKIEKNKNDAELTIALEGRLDTNTSPQLEKELKDEIDGVTSLTFDFKALEYISSAGLRVLLSAQKIMNKQGSMKITNVNSEIMEIFEVTGFSDILDIE